MFLESPVTKAAVLHDLLEVYEAMFDMLSSLSSVLTTGYYCRPGFPVKVMFNIVELFWIC